MNAVELARKHGPKVAGQAIYISSVTDPYLPAERGLGLTRGILEALIPHQPRILIQTRGPLVVRDIDLLGQFSHVRVNMSINADNEQVRRTFEPKAPPLERRWEAVVALRAAAIPVGICVTPMLPLENTDAFVKRLAAFKPDVLVVQDFHDSGGGFGADTGGVARRLLAKSQWTRASYDRFKEQLGSCLHVYEGEAGFFPPG